VSEDPFQQTLEQLAQALAQECAGQEGTWARQLGAVLADVEQALGRHTQAIEGPNGSLSKVDLTRPTLLRRVGDVRQQHRTLQEALKELRGELGRAAEAFERHAHPGLANEALPPLKGPDAVPDFGAVRRRAEEIVSALRKLEEEEADLLLETVNMDLGAGD
jgi:uncharacterized protein YukE